MQRFKISHIGVIAVSVGVLALGASPAIASIRNAGRASATACPTPPVPPKGTPPVPPKGTPPVPPKGTPPVPPKGTPPVPGAAACRPGKTQ
jgi:hypothetical protein